MLIGTCAVSAVTRSRRYRGVDSRSTSAGFTLGFIVWPIVWIIGECINGAKPSGRIPFGSRT